MQGERQGSQIVRRDSIFVPAVAGKGEDLRASQLLPVLPCGFDVCAGRGEWAGVSMKDANAVPRDAETMLVGADDADSLHSLHSGRGELANCPALSPTPVASTFLSSARTRDAKTYASGVLSKTVVPTVDPQLLRVIVVGANYPFDIGGGGA